MEADLALIAGAGALAARLPLLRGIPVREVLESLCGAVRAQPDFAQEAESLQKLRDALSTVPRVWVPRPVRYASCDRALVMEYIPGLDPATPSRCPAAARKGFAAGVLAAVYRMLFIDGFVHCDLHPGNLYFTERGQVVVLDAGFAVKLPDRIRVLFAEFFLNMALGRGERCAEIVIASGCGGRARRGHRRLHAMHGRPGGAQLRAPDPRLQPHRLRNRDVRPPAPVRAGAATELVFPLLSLLIIEGTVRELDPDADFQQAARATLIRGLFGAR